jgi:hypothetical protein
VAGVLDNFQFGAGQQAKGGQAGTQLAAAFDGQQDGLLPFTDQSLP